MSEVTKNVFLEPKFVGERFEQHTIPLDLLKDLAVLQQLISSTARWHYLNDNTERVRTPNGFSEWGQLELADIKPGSAIPVITLGMSQNIPDDAELSFYNNARDSMIRAIEAASADDSSSEKITEFLSPALLSFFDRIGRSLKDGEWIEFPKRSKTAKLDSKARKRLTKAAQLAEYTKEVKIRGSVSQVKLDLGTLKVDVITGSSVDISLAPEYLDNAMQALKTYNDVAPINVLVVGIGRFDRSDTLKFVESVDQFVILDPLDVGARLDLLKNLKPGWLDVDQGKQLSSERLEALTSLFEKYYGNDLTPPFLFPTEEGNVQAEWQTESYNITLEVDLETLDSELLLADRHGDNDVEMEISLSDAEGWKQLNKELVGYIG